MKKIVLIMILVSCTMLMFAKNPWLGQDKAAHFTCSTFLTYWNYGVAYDILGNNRPNSLLISVNLTAMLGIAKEYSDKKITKTGWSWHDLAYDLAGIACGLVLINNLR